MYLWEQHLIHPLLWTDVGKLRPKGETKDGNSKQMCSPKPLPPLLAQERFTASLSGKRQSTALGCQPRAQLDFSPARHWDGCGGNRNIVGGCGERGRDEAANGRKPGRYRPPCVPLQGPGPPTSPTFGFPPQPRGRHNPHNSRRLQRQPAPRAQTRRQRLPEPEGAWLVRHPQSCPMVTCQNSLRQLTPHAALLAPPSPAPSPSPSVSLRPNVEVCSCPSAGSSV